MDELEILKEKISSWEFLYFCNDLLEKFKIRKSILSFSLCLKYKNIYKDLRIYIVKTAWREKGDFSWFKIL